MVEYVSQKTVRVVGVGLGMLSVCASSCSGSASSASSSTDPNASAKWTQYCKDDNARRSACGATVDDASCLEQGPCIAGGIRAEAVDPLIACLRGRSCGQGDDACSGQAASPFESEPDVRAFEQGCLQKRTECTQSGMSFSDDYCASVGLAVSSLVASLNSCLSHPCDDVKACLASAFNAVGCN